MDALAYDLALRYAQAKLADKLSNGNDFGKTAMPESVEEMQYLFDRFAAALEFFSNCGQEELEAKRREFRNGRY